MVRLYNDLDILSFGSFHGFAYVLNRSIIHTPRYLIETGLIEHEINRFQESIVLLVSHLTSLSVHEPNSDFKDIIDAQIKILTGSTLKRGIETIIRQASINTEAAIQDFIAEISSHYKTIKDDYLAERANDFKMIGNKIIHTLNRSKSRIPINLPRHSVVIADDLSPIEIIQLIKFNPVGIILENCGKFSHTAIIASSANFPVIVLKTEICDYIKPFEKILFNAQDNSLIIRPTEQELSYSKTTHSSEKIIFSSSLSYNNSPIRLLANIEPFEKIDKIDYPSQGYGLIRTEFLYFQSTSPPQEDKITYLLEKICLNTPAHHPITIRTPDLGGDKTPLFYNNFFEKYQSSLSLRGIGLTLKYPDILIPNLRSILKLSERFKNIRILLPMVKSIDDILQTKKLINHLISQLQHEKLIGKNYQQPLIGAMIEVPAVAICADQLAPYCDFFSIGGNDLVQFTMAADRNDKNQQDYFINHPEAIFRLIENTVKNSKKFHKIATTICGDFRKQSYVLRLLECGLRDFSTAYSHFPEFIKNIHGINHLADNVIIPA